MRSILGLVSSIRYILIVILTPILLLPVTLCIQGQESSCAYVILIMAVYWITEALPLNVTALLPVFMFPMVGVMSAGDVAKVFFTSTSLMFLGGMAVGVAIEEWDIHKRIALKILLILGAKPVWLMLGLMLTSWFLSMWISNTATVAMMLPIATAILEQLKCYNKRDEINPENSVVLLPMQNGKVSSDVNLNNLADVEIDVNSEGHNKENTPDEKDHETNSISADEDAAWTRFSKALSLCMAYAANVGGTASMTGSTPNLVLKGQLETAYKDLGERSPLTFGNWLAFGIPTSLVIVLLSWLWLQLYFLRCRGFSGCCIKHGRDDEKSIRAILKREYQKLGPFTFAQVSVLMHLLLIALLWITRDLGGTFGWAGFFKDNFIKDSVPAAFVACLLFIFPSKLPKLSEETNSKPIKPLLSWKVFNAKMPWGVVLLLGGGFAMAKASQVSGLSEWIGNQLLGLSHLDPWVLNLVICLIVAAATEVTSNTATTALMLPIIADLSLKVGLQPLYLMYPISFAASFAFMLPVATPPNVIVFSYGYVRVIDMIKAGFVLNIIAVAVLVISNEFFGAVIFGSKFL